MNDKQISLKTAIKAICQAGCNSEYCGVSCPEVLALEALPSAQPELDVLAWLLAYHTKSFELHGRYLPHEVISWLVNDFSKEFIAERREEGENE